MRPDLITIYKESILVTIIKINQEKMTFEEFEVFKASLKSVYEAPQPNGIVYDLTSARLNSFSPSQILNLIKHLKSFQTVTTERYNKCVIIVVKNPALRYLAGGLIAAHGSAEQKRKTQFCAQNIDIDKTIEKCLASEQ